MSLTSENKAAPPAETGTKTATIYRMVMPDHLCPYGLKSLDLLAREGYDVDDRHLETEEEADAFRRRTRPASKIYPYAETGAGLLMSPAVLNWISVPVALFIGTIGGASVAMAIWMGATHLL
jgi:glutaredoxin